MAAMRGPRLQAGSAAWVSEERASALQITDSEVEEFTYSARNEFDWLNEHMAGIFNENETNIAETFKTPGKLRGKTPRTARKVQPPEPRVPLSDVFGATPSSTANRMAQQLGQTQSPRLPPTSPSPVKGSSPRRNVFSSPKPTLPQPATQDSGYYGSQDIASMEVDLVDGDDISNIDQSILNPLPAKSPARTIASDSPEKTSPFTKEDQTTRALPEPDAATTSPHVADQEHIEVIESVASDPTSRHTSAAPSSPTKKQPEAFKSDEEEQEEEGELESEQVETRPDHSSPGEARSPSDTSSPIQVVPMRKSSLNFASLPAREPLTAGKARVSRTSHLDHNRTSYYGRHTGGKSLGNYTRHDKSDDEDRDEMDVDDFTTATTQDPQCTKDVAVHHNKTYTQRLQDQISMLGKSQPNGSRPSKSLHGSSSQHVAINSQSAQEPRSPSLRKQEPTATTPDAFPEDDDDDWIDPPAMEPSAPERPALPKSHSTDVMEGIHDKDMATGIDAASQPQKMMSQKPATIGHGKSASVSVIHAASEYRDGSPLKTIASVPITSIATETDRTHTLNKSPSRHLRDSPLKQVKNKLSSILKTSKGLLASSAAISAEGKSSILSSSTTRLDTYATTSDSSKPKGSVESQRLESESPAMQRDASPTRFMPRRTRASAEREKEEKRREREAMLMAEQMDKLEKAREKEREKARTFSKEQQRVAAMEKQVVSKKDNEHPIPKETPKPTRASPRKTKTQPETISKSADQDVDMTEAPSTVPPSASRSVGPGQSHRNKETRRPVKPGKETQTKTKPTPTVIRVNTGSQHSQFHPGSSTMSTSFQDPSSQAQQPASKASKAPTQSKQSMHSMKSSVSSNSGRPKALDIAAKKKEQDDREAQRRRDAKAEFERKRAAAQEEQRKQEQRRMEAEKQKQKEREQVEAKKSTQRQAAIEKAKQTRAPPPAVRSQPNGPPDHTQSSSSQRDENQPPRPPSRLNSGIFRSQEDIGRPVNAILSTAKSKRPLGQDSGEASQARHAPSYGGPQYQAKDAKRRRTSDEFADELDMDHPPNIKGPPVRPSGGFKKDLQAKSIFQNGYSNVPQSASRDLFKATVTAQLTSQTKTAHPLDMAQISKGAIPFAPNSAAGQSFKTPARPGMAKPPPKSALRSSPRFQNGELIELPEIQTDDEDDDDDDETNGMTVAAWADSPDLRRALMRQETMDPAAIFGPPAPLNMEEVFNRGKEKFHKFRARTSSANWSGADRLTEEDIRKDMAARDKMRREGGWSYEMSREMM